MVTLLRLAESDMSHAKRRTHPHHRVSLLAKLPDALAANLKLIVQVLLLGAAAILSAHLSGRSERPAFGITELQDERVGPARRHEPSEDRSSRVRLTP